MKKINEIISLAIKIAVQVLLLAAVVCTFLPIMSAYCGGSEPFTLVTRVINLTEFSAWGTAAVLTPLVLAAIYYAKIDNKTRVLSLIGMNLLYSVAYVEAVKRAHKWLEEVCTGWVEKYPVMLLYPLAIFAVSALMYADMRKI